MERKREIADRLLAYLKEQGADAAQVEIAEEETKEFNVDSGEFTLMRTLFDRRVTLSVIRDSRYGTVTTNRFDEEGLMDLAQDALAAAESAEVDEARQFDDSSRTERHEEGTPECDTEKLFQRSKEFLDTIHENYKKLIVEQMITRHVNMKVLYRNSYGTTVETEGGNYGFYVGYAAHEGESSSHSYGSFAQMKDLSRPFIECALTRKELEDTEKQACPEPFQDKFTGTVVFTPDCLGDVVFGTILSEFVSDRPLIEGTSGFKDKLGQQVADSRITLSLAPGDERITGNMSYTGEGYPAEDYDIIRDGVLQNFCLSQYGANKTGGKRGGNTTSAMVSPAGGKSLSEIISGIERGILIGRFSGGEPGANGEFSGVAKNSFLIENGQLTKALSETMISANLYEMLFHLKDISSETMDNGEVSLPYMAFDGITISGK